jgi:hypothetical protein
VATFRAALKLRVWQQIASGAHLAQQISQANGWDITGARMLLDALCSMKLLDKDERGNQLVPVAVAYLIPGTPNYMGDTLLASRGWEGNGRLPEAIRTGKRTIVSDWTSSGIAAVWDGYEAPSRPRPEKVIEGKAEI